MKYFIVSDTHSFYSELMQTLNDVGFDFNNPEHIFVLCGDLFDRGKESKEILEWVKSLPKERRVLIRGNHEYLLRDLLKKDFPDSWDFSNGTVRTCCDLTGYDIYDVYYSTYSKFFDTGYNVWNQVRKDMKKYDLVKWIFSDEWVNYYEINDLILVHSFIPLKDNSDVPTPPYVLYGHNYSYRKDWRRASLRSWEDATWGCPYILYMAHLFDEEIKKGKTLVCGHWHTNDFHDAFRGLDEEPEESYEVFHKGNLIALDGCIALTHQCNILVVNEDGTLTDRFNNPI